jgi:hypothetical protein
MKTPHNPSLVEQIESLDIKIKESGYDSEDDWNLICLLLDKIQMSARSRYYRQEEQRMDEKTKANTQ